MQTQNTKQKPWIYKRGSLYEAYNLKLNYKMNIKYSSSLRWQRCEQKWYFGYFVSHGRLYKKGNVMGYLPEYKKSRKLVEIASYSS